jgi:large subunit ribosomal protein L15
VKLHDLHPAPGSRRKRTRVGRGIAAGQGKTAGRGTKGQKARAGASIPAWFEGGQTPIHIRVPKLRGFKNRFKVEFQVVNVGQISEYAAAGRFGVEGAKKDSPVTVNAETLESSGLIGSAEKPVKVLGHGDVAEKVFVAADAFSASARKKIEDAGGFVQVLAPEKTEPDADVSKKSKSKRANAADSDDAQETTARAEAVAAADAPAEAAPEAAADQAEPVTSQTDGESVVAEAPAKAPRKRSSSKTSSES